MMLSIKTKPTSHSVSTIVLDDIPHLARTDCKSTKKYTTRGNLLPFPKLHQGTCTSIGMRRRTDTLIDRQTRRQMGRHHNTFHMVMPNVKRNERGKVFQYKYVVYFINK